MKENFDIFLIVMALLAAVVYAALHFFEAGYGYLFDRRYGPPVPNRMGWMVPAYTMPKNIDEMIVMRIVVRQGMSRDMADMLLGDIRNAVTEFEKLRYPTPSRIKYENKEHQKGKVYTH